MSDLLERIKAFGIEPEEEAEIVAEIKRLREFIESITVIGGPYPDLNGHQIVADARKALSE